MGDREPALRCERCGHVTRLDLPAGICPECGAAEWRLGELIEE